MSELERLLDVQRHDTIADQLRHRRQVLPERAQLAEAQAALGATESALVSTTAARDALAETQDRLEGDIAQSRARIATVNATMYGGSVSTPRELQALQDEIASLERRIGLLEDEELGVMEQLEPLEAAVVAAEGQLELLRGEIERLGQAITTGEAEVDVELAANEAERSALAAAVPEVLLVEYERIRSQSGGIGVAALTAGQCGGCHIRLSAVELDRIRKQPADSIEHCEECGRLLVH